MVRHSVASYRLDSYRLRTETPFTAEALKWQSFAESSHALGTICIVEWKWIVNGTKTRKYLLSFNV
jgi:hypothetical protein